MNYMRQLWSWSSSRGGPKQGALVFLDGTFKEFDLLGHSWYEEVKDLKEEQVIGITWGPFPGCKRPGWTVQYEKPTLWFGPSTGHAPDCPSRIEDAVSKIVELYKQAKVEQAELEADPAKHLEEELSRHDWYSHYSDDASVCGSGDVHGQYMQEIAKKLSKDVVDALYDKYRPKVS